MSLWDTCPRNPNRLPLLWSDPRWFAGAPTRDQAKAIWWEDLKRLTPPEWIHRVYESDLCIRTKWQAELWVVGLDKPQRIEGRSWDGGVIDEFADCRPTMLDANIRPALADRNGWLWLIGVPDASSPGQIEYRNLVQRAMSDLAHEWGVYSWPSADILPAAEVESARHSMDPRLFAQEMLGEFILDGGRAFPDFDRQIHVKADIAKYDPALPICWSLDFNVDPFSTGVIQFDADGVVRVIDEIEVQSTVTPVMVDAFLERAQQRGWNLANLRIYGDPAGHQRRTTSAKANTTDWTIVRNLLKDHPHEFKVRAGAIPIADGRNAVNAKLKTADGIVKMYIHPQCRRIINDLDSLLWPSDLSEGHACAWLRYFVEREYPVKRQLTVSDGLVAGVAY